MFIVNEDNSIYLTRGDVAFFSVSVETDEGEMLKFQPGDVVRFKVTKKNACNNVVLSKDFGIEAETEEVEIYLEGDETKFGGVISKPQEFWYEVELNPYTDPQTILGYDDENGPKIFKLFPEGGDAVEKDPVTEEDIPVVDEELSLTSTRPVQNQAISRAIVKIKEDVKAELSVAKEEIRGIRDEAERVVADVKLEDITDSYISEVYDGVTISNIQAYKQGKLIGLRVDAEVTLSDEVTHLFKIADYFPNSGSVVFSGWRFDVDELGTVPIIGRIERTFSIANFSVYPCDYTGAASVSFNVVYLVQD